MKFELAKYRRFERNPIGCFDAEMTANGWAKTKYTNESDLHLSSAEINEFVHLVHDFFHECEDWIKLRKYAEKHGTNVDGTGYDITLAFNFIGERLDYTAQVKGTALTIFPFRKISHKGGI